MPSKTTEPQALTPGAPASIPNTTTIRTTVGKVAPNVEAASFITNVSDSQKRAVLLATTQSTCTRYTYAASAHSSRKNSAKSQAITTQTETITIATINATNAVARAVEIEDPRETVHPTNAVTTDMIAIVVAITAVAVVVEAKAHTRAETSEPIWLNPSISNELKGLHEAVAAAAIAGDANAREAHRVHAADLVTIAVTMQSQLSEHS